MYFYSSCTVKSFHVTACLVYYTCLDSGRFCRTVRLGIGCKVNLIWSCTRDHSTNTNNVAMVGRIIIAKVSACIRSTSDPVRAGSWISPSQRWSPIQYGCAGTSCSTSLRHHFIYIKFIHRCFSKLSLQQQ